LREDERPMPSPPAPDSQKQLPNSTAVLLAVFIAVVSALACYWLTHPAFLVWLAGWFG
jgi:hypothetical protein